MQKSGIEQMPQLGQPACILTHFEKECFITIIGFEHNKHQTNSWFTLWKLQIGRTFSNASSQARFLNSGRDVIN